MAKNKGNYYKLRTKRWLEVKGYHVCFLERVMWIPKEGRNIPIKKDQMGADLLAVSAEEIVFVQVKLHAKNVGAARLEFAKYTFPPFAQRWTVVWTPGAREPEIDAVG